MENSCSLLPPTIIRPPSGQFLFHSDFDNFDEFVYDIAGAGSVHRTNGIMLQEILEQPGTPEDVGSVQLQSMVVPKTGQRSSSPQFMNSKTVTLVDATAPRLISSCRQ